MTDFADDEQTPITPAYILEVWQRRRWLAVLVAVVTIAAAVAIIRSLPDLYRSSATVLVERPVSDEFVKASVSSRLETRIQSLQQYVTSRDHLSQMIDEMNLYPNERRFASIDELVAKMRRDITLQLKGVEQTTGGMATYAFTVGYTARDPQTVARVVNDLVNTYTSENMSTRQREAATTAEFLREQLDEVRRALDAQDRQTRTYAMAHTSELPQQLGANLATLERLHGELSLNNEQQVRLTERRERLEQEAAAVPVIAPASETTSPQTRLMGLKQQLAQLRRSFSAEYPDVRRVSAEIAALEADISAAGVDPKGPSVDPSIRRTQELRELDATLKSLKQQELDLRGRSAQYETLVGITPRRQIELDQLSRGRDSLSQRYQELVNQFDVARQASVLEQDHGAETFRVLDAAIPPRAPVAPNRSLLELMAVALGITLSAIAVAAAEKVDSAVHTPGDLRDIVAPDAVVCLRRISTRRSRRRTWARATFATVGVVIAGVLAAVVAQFALGGSEWIVRMMVRGGA